MSKQNLCLRGIALIICVAIGATALAAGENTREQTPLKKVTFTFTPLSRYENVFLAGTFNGWSTDATKMERDGSRFQVSLPLPIGEHRYKFVADGQWITDEKAAGFAPDGYGGRNSVIVVDQSFEEWALARGDGKIRTEGLSHRGYAWERTVGADGRTRLRIRAWMGDVEGAEICWHPGIESLAGPVPPIPERCDTMALLDNDGTYDYFEAAVDSQIFSYYFKLTDGATEIVMDRSGTGDAGGRSPNPFDFDASQVKVFSTPEWVKGAVIYQIFPERFANGSRENDPDFREWYYAGLSALPPSGKSDGEYFHLVPDWYDIAGLKASPYRSDGKPDWNSFYGGDIEGIRRNLDYLADLGITAIYLNPIFTAKSNHKYDAATFMGVDPHFATNEEFTRFVTACHDRGIRVILDLALNHTGHTFRAFVDARQRGRESAYWDWYEWKMWPVPGDSAYAPPDAKEYYDCWWDFGQMPNLNFDLARPNAEEQSVTAITDAQPNWPLVNHLLDAAAFWLAEIGVDGYRLDVANEVPFWFWELFRQRVKATKPDAYIVGELWGQSSEWVNGRYFDAVMNYKFFREPVLAFLAKGTIGAEQFDRALAPGRLVYPEAGVRAMMNLIGSHDTERFLTTSGGDIRRLNLAALFAMTYVGAPTIYYGDEIATAGGGDPDCRRPFYWKWQEDEARREVHDRVRALVALRKDHPCFALGNFTTLLAQDMIYVYRRSLPNDTAIVAINAGSDQATVEIPADREIVQVRDALTGDSLAVAAGETGRVFTATLPALSGTIFLPVAGGKSGSE